MCKIMDEFWFYLSNRLEVLQVQASLATQQGQQWITAWLAECYQLLVELCDEGFIQHINSITELLFNCIQKWWKQLRFQYHSIHFNTAEFYQQLVSRKQVAFCLMSLATGILIGYCIGRSWRHSPRHVIHMKAAICHHYIGIEGVSLIEDTEMPIIKKSNELLIQVKAASVNVVDTKICHGYSKIYRKLLNSGKQRDLPVTLGRDCAGIVIEIGHNVVNFDIGDEVFLATPSWAPGTIAEYITIPESQVMKRPKRISFEAAASLPYNGCLAFDALINRSVIKEGDAKGKRVLLCGGTTPIGCVLTQLIKLWGGYVVSICRSHAVSVAKALGADETISSNNSDIEKQLELYENFHAIFYTGGDPIDERILKKHLISYGSYTSTVPEHLTSDSLGFVFGSIFAGCVRIKLLVQYMFGFNMHQWKEGSKLNLTYLQALCQLVEADRLQPAVDKVYAPQYIDQALQHVLDLDAIGSTVITFR